MAKVVWQQPDIFQSFPRKCLPLLPPCRKVDEFRYVAVSMATGLPPLAATPMGVHFLGVLLRSMYF